MPTIYDNEDDEPGKNGTFPNGDSPDGGTLFFYLVLVVAAVALAWYLASVWL